MTNYAAGLSRKIVGPTISSTLAMRAIGVSEANTFSCSATSRRIGAARSNGSIGRGRERPPCSRRAAPRRARPRQGVARNRERRDPSGSVRQG